MNIKYTKESFTHKPDWVSECKRLHWKLHQGGFYDYIYLWQTGHIMDIGDNELMDFIIVDIDDLPEGKREWLNTHTVEITNALDVKSCHVFDSSSRNPKKCKVFLELFVPVPIKEMESVLTDFEIYCDVAVDKCTKSPYQLNFGIMLDDPKYRINKDVFAADIPSARTTKISKETFLPINQQEKNRLLGKHAYNDPRLEWNYYKFLYRNNQWIRDRIVIKQGQRQKILYLIVKISTFNALMLNKLYRRAYTHVEVYNKVCSVVALQYEAAGEFLKQNRNNIYRACYNEWHNQVTEDLDNLYKHLCKKLNKPEKYTYTPRDYSGAALYRMVKDELNSLPLDEVYDRIGYIAEGNDQLMRTIFDYYKRDHKEIRKKRSDTGKQHVYKTRKNTLTNEALVNSLEVKNGVYLIPKNLLTNALTQYLYRKKKKYQKI
jgi:hypothetical protein